MGLRLVKLRGWSWLIERVRLMPAPLLVVVFMILINIHQSGIKNQVSEGFHDLKIILNIECTNACGWELGFIPSFVRLMFECSCVQSVAKTPHLLYQLFLTWSKSLQNLSLQYRCCRLLHVQICGDNVCCPPQGCPQSSFTHTRRRRWKSKTTPTKLYSLSLSLLTSSQEVLV